MTMPTHLLRQPRSRRFRQRQRRRVLLAALLSAVLAGAAYLLR